MRTLLAGVIFMFGAGLCFADPAEGYWLSLNPKTNKPNAGWYVYVQGGALYAKMLSAPGYGKDDTAVKLKASYKGYPVPGDVSKMKVFNDITWVYGLTSVKSGVWGGGVIIDPESSRGASYSCKITFHAADGAAYEVDTLEVYGSAGPVGRTSIWRRASEDAASNLR